MNIEENRNDIKIWICVDLGLSSSSVRPCLVYTKPWTDLSTLPPSTRLCPPTTLNHPYTSKRKQPTKAGNWLSNLTRTDNCDRVSLYVAQAGHVFSPQSSQCWHSLCVPVCVPWCCNYRQSAVSCTMWCWEPQGSLLEEHMCSRSQGRLSLSLDDTVSLQESAKTWCGCS